MPRKQTSLAWGTVLCVHPVARELELKVDVEMSVTEIARDLVGESGHWIESRGKARDPLRVSRQYGGTALFRQRFADGFARFPNLGLAFARDDNRMGIRVMLLGDGAGDADHLGGNDVNWPSGWQGKFL